MERLILLTSTTDKRSLIPLLLLLGFIVLPEPVLAGAAQAMPYDTALNNILNSLTGTVARVAGAIAIVLFGLGLAFSEGGGFLKKAIGILFGLTIAFNAGTWGLAFFGFGAGLVV